MFVGFGQGGVLPGQPHSPNLEIGFEDVQFVRTVFVVGRVLVKGVFGEYSYFFVSQVGFLNSG